MGRISLDSLCGGALLERFSLAMAQIGRNIVDPNTDPEKARSYRESSRPEKEDTCSMCGNFCAVKNMNRILDGEIVSIYEE